MRKLLLMVMMIVTVTLPVSAASKMTVEVDKGVNLNIKETVVGYKIANPTIALVKGKKLIGISPGRTSVKVITRGRTYAYTVTVKHQKPKWVNTNKVYTLLNKTRKAKRVGTLKKDAYLTRIAEIRAKEIAISGKFSHIRPNGKRGLSLINRKSRGENLGKGQTSCERFHKALYKSKGHRENMLRKKFKRVGIAAYKYEGTIYWVEVFSS